MRISKDRVSLLAADVALTGKARAAAGLADGAFDFAIMNPPFNAGHDRATPDALKRDAHVMPDGLFERWIRSAAAIVKPRGGLAVIARPQSLEPILAALGGRFGKVEILPVHPRPDAPAIRIVVRAVRGLAGRAVAAAGAVAARGSRRWLLGTRRRHQQRPRLAFRRLRLACGASRHCADAGKCLHA